MLQCIGMSVPVKPARKVSQTLSLLLFSRTDPNINRTLTLLRTKSNAIVIKFSLSQRSFSLGGSLSWRFTGNSGEGVFRRSRQFIPSAVCWFAFFPSILETPGATKYIKNCLLEILEPRGLSLSWPTNWSHRELLETMGWGQPLRI